MAYKIAIPQDVTDTGKDFLRKKGYDIIIGNESTDAEALRKIIAGADAILARTAVYSAEVLDAAKNLKVISRHGIGVDNIDVDYCTEHGIYVTYAPGSNSVSVAEHTIGFIIACAHNFARFDRGTRKGEWELRNRMPGLDLEGKTLGIMGLGRIGTMVAKKCMAAFDMKVIAYDPLLAQDKMTAGVCMEKTAADVFEKADFVSLHLPSTDDTRGMINRDLIFRMKPTAFLINCARGDVMNERDLYDALTSGAIRGAACDVYNTEPAEPENPLFSLENIIVTPHSAALTEESFSRMGLYAAMGIDDVLSGRKPEWPLNEPVL